MATNGTRSPRFRFAPAVWALAQWELTRRLRDRLTLVAAVIFAAVLIVGHVPAWRYGATAPEDGRLYPIAFFAAMLLTLRIGWAEDRAVRFDEYLVANFVSVREYFAAKLLASGAHVVAFTLFGFVVALVLSGGAAGWALWYASLYLLYVLLFLPLLVFVELVSTIRHPAAVAALLYFLTVLLAEPLVGADAFVRFIVGLPEVRLSFAELVPLAARVLLVTPLLLALLYPFVRRKLDPLAGAAKRSSEERTDQPQTTSAGGGLPSL